MKAYFLTRQLREKLLIIGLIGVGLAFWVTHLLAANSAYRESDAATTKTRADQETVLNDEVAIKAAQQSVIAKFADPKESIRDAGTLSEALLAMAQAANLSPLPNIPKATSTPGAQLTVLTQQLTLTNLEPDMSTLIKFYKLLAAKAPYLTIVKSDITVTGGRGGRGGAAGAAGGFGNTAATNPGGGFAGGGAAGGGRRGGAQLGTVGQLDFNPAGAARGTAAGQPVRTQPTGPRLSATFTLTAISITTPGSRAGAAPAAAPARRGG
jgi:hypothetical protein